MSAQTIAKHDNRLDALDGLRTVAVFLVILFHVSAPTMAAGYLGVDIFFVLSGYFITGGLIRSIRRDGKISLANFWVRRIKRLMPAAILVLLAVLVWAQWFAPIYRRQEIGADAWWTVFYLANWRFIGSTSYFAADGTESPLLHMWSLAVEEQFYVFWPLLVALITWAVLRRKRGSTSGADRALGALTVATGVGVVASVILMWQLAAHVSTDRAYMGTDTKAFELLLGALAALFVARPAFAAWVARWARPLIWGGGIVMLALFAVLDGPAPFYFKGGAALFSIATAALLLGVAHKLNGFEARILAFAPISYLGRISYGLYLWHWPWAQWILGDVKEFQPLKALLVIVITVVCAALSYHLIEMPIRQGALSKWLSTRKTLFAAASTIIVTALLATLVGGTPLSKTVRPLIAGSSLNENVVMLVGDSVPKRLTPELSKYVGDYGFELVSAARGGCSPMAYHMELGPADQTGAQCPDVRPVQDETLQQYQPGVVLWWSRYEVIDRYTDSGRLISPDSEEFWREQEKAFKLAADRFTADGATLAVVLTERPGLGMLSRPAETLELPLLQNMIYHDEYRQRFNEIVKQVAAQRDSVVVLDGDSLFCAPGAGPGPGGLCDDAVGDQGYIRPDGSHVNNELFGARVSKALLEQLKTALGR
ncbi:acyltransferase family protein [Canibacter zhoujuaniae]|uniref:acyltransferase family protein n=1 Tax=Canibacter zhoujuaniae TaxID=2708343 RepID=UPI001421E7BA|nr:acyltransferase family protein [Canibacter zhoujuaniae]